MNAHTPLPGQRMIDGKPYTFDMGLLNSHRADMLIAAAPADLSGLPYEASGPGEMSLTGLKYALMDRDQRFCKAHGGRPEPDAFAKRLWAEITARDDYQRAFGGKARQAVAA